MSASGLRSLKGKADDAAKRKPAGFWKRPDAPRRPHRKEAAVVAGVEAPAPAAAAAGPAPASRAPAPAPKPGTQPDQVEVSETTKAMLAKPFLAGLLEDAYAMPYEIWAEAVEVPEVVPSAARRERVVAGVVEIIKANPREWMKWLPAIAIVAVVSGDVQHGFMAMKAAKKRRQAGTRGTQAEVLAERVARGAPALPTQDPPVARPAPAAGAPAAPAPVRKKGPRGRR